MYFEQELPFSIWDFLIFQWSIPKYLTSSCMTRVLINVDSMTIQELIAQLQTSVLCQLVLYDDHVFGIPVSDFGWVQNFIPYITDDT